jgi:hypothetical protein
MKPVSLQRFDSFEALKASETKPASRSLRLKRHSAFKKVILVLRKAIDYPRLG